MTTTAYEFTSACNAGLSLFGQDMDGQPEWMGTATQWKTYNHLTHHHDNHS